MTSLHFVAQVLKEGYWKPLERIALTHVGNLFTIDLDR